MEERARVVGAKHDPIVPRAVAGEVTNERLIRDGDPEAPSNLEQRRTDRRRVVGDIERVPFGVLIAENGDAEEAGNDDLV